MIRGLLRFGCDVIITLAVAVIVALAEQDEEPTAVLARTDPAFAERMDRLGGLFAEEPTR